MTEKIVVFSNVYSILIMVCVLIRLIFLNVVGIFLDLFQKIYITCKQINLALNDR